MPVIMEVVASITVLMAVITAPMASITSSIPVIRKKGNQQFDPALAV